MTAQGESYPHHFFAKRWHPAFAERRNFKETVSYVESMRRIGATGDNFDRFWKHDPDLQDAVPFSKILDVKNFCHGVSPEDLEPNISPADFKRSGWLEDRSLSCGSSRKNCRQYKNWPSYRKRLTAAELYHSLKLEQFDHAHYPDADRRLIFIADLDPYYILALTETAQEHQVSALRNAILQHLGFQTSLCVLMARGFLTYQLDFHLPFLLLRPLSIKKNDKNGLKNKPPRKYTDISFMATGNPDGWIDQTNYGIFEAHFSLSIVGSDNQRWSAYSFADDELDADNLEDDEVNAADEENSGEEEGNEGYYEDPIVPGDSDHPIMDSREYFLKILDARTCQSLSEWTCIVHTLDRSIRDYENNHPSTFLQRPRNEEYRHADIQTTYTWTIQTLVLLGYTLKVLSATGRAWEIFKSIDGDIGYFSNMEPSSKTPGGYAQSALHNIKNTFVKLEDLRQQLLSLEKSCERSKTDLELRLTLESNETAKENVRTASITVKIISPFTLVTAYFSMPGSLIPFETTVSSFFITLAVSMLIVWLVFAIFSSVMSRPWHRKELAAWIEKLGLRGIARRLVTGTQDIGVGMKRCLTFPNETTGEIEMTGFERRPWHDIRGKFRQRVWRGKGEEDTPLPGP